MDLKHYLADQMRVPTGFVGIGPADHPTKPNTSGQLARNRNTGIYVLIVGGAVVGVPHKWAADTAADMGKAADAIQDACIARMAALDLNPNQVADKLDGRVSRTHVCDFLSRRASLGTHKLQHLLPALGLKIIGD